jgi:4-amino-4-deoxy-L-arabinose transferase-like glycosyltransferase
VTTSVTLFLIALVLRLVAVWVFPETHLGTNAEIAYLGGAHTLVEGRGFRDPTFPVFTPPLYAMVIAGSLYLFGNGEMPVRLAQGVADAAMVVVVYLIARLLLGPRAALWAGALLVVYPFSIYAATYIGPETFFTLLLGISLWLSLHAFRSDGIAYDAAGGACLGLATLMRGTTLYLPVLLLLMVIYLNGVSRKVLAKWAVFTFAFALVIVPWSIRNYIVLGDVIPVATIGSVLLQGSSEQFLTVDGKAKEYPAYFALLKSRGLEPKLGGSLAEADKFLVRAAIESYRIRFETRPFSIVPFMIMKFGRLWFATESGRSHAGILILNLPIYVFAVAGAVMAWHRHMRLALAVLGGTVAYFAVLHWLSFPLFRYMVPAMPFVICLSAFGAEGMWDLVRRNRVAGV